MSAAHAIETKPPKSASVDVLTAEVRAVMVGNRQVTLSVYRQLDRVEVEDIEPWGRVRASKDSDGKIELIGRDKAGNLVASSAEWGGNQIWMGEASQYKKWIAIQPHVRRIVDFTVLLDGEYRALLRVHPDRVNGSYGNNEPFGSYASDETQRALEAHAAHLIAERRQQHAHMRRLAELPLIVLAGLR